MKSPANYLVAATLLALFGTSSVMARDRDDNPPGPRGGPGTNWENPRGPAGGPGASPNRHRRDRDNNPPGPIGGRGTNWENPPGPRGGIGASPDIRHRHSGWLRDRIGPADWALFMTWSLVDQQRFCDKRGIHRDYCWFDRDDNPPGPAGGPGTNWENPPGPAGGPGASPDRR